MHVYISVCVFVCGGGDRGVKIDMETVEWEAEAWGLSLGGPHSWPRVSQRLITQRRSGCHMTTDSLCDTIPAPLLSQWHFNEEAADHKPVSSSTTDSTV